MNADSTLDPLRILLIDDRRDALLPVQKLLQYEKHAVATAGDGPTAVSKAAEFFCRRSCFCDIGLPGGMDGDMQWASPAQASPRRPTTYLVALTG